MEKARETFIEAPPQVRVCEGVALRGGGREIAEGVGEGCTSEGCSLPTNVLLQPRASVAAGEGRKQCELN